MAVLLSAFDIEMIFHSYVYKTHLHKKVRVFGTWKWPVSNVPGKSVISKVLERVIAKTSFRCPLT